MSSNQGEPSAGPRGILRAGLPLVAVGHTQAGRQASRLLAHGVFPLVTSEPIGKPEAFRCGLWPADLVGLLAGGLRANGRLACQQAARIKRQPKQ